MGMIGAMRLITAVMRATGVPACFKAIVLPSTTKTVVWPVASNF